MAIKKQKKAKKGNGSLTMQRMAEELGLSRYTVSMVINATAREHGISEETIQKVEAFLAERGFVPSRHAVELRASGKKQPGSIGVLYCDDLNPHQLEAFNQIIQYFNHTPRRLEIMAAKRPEISRSLREMVSRGVRQLIWIHSQSPAQELGASLDLLPLLQNLQTTVIYNYRFGENGWDEKLNKAKIHRVGVDRTQGIAELADLLQGLGHRAVYLYAVQEWQPEAIRKIWSAFEKPGCRLVYSAVGLDRNRPSSLDLTPDRAVSFGQTVAQDIIRQRAEAGITAACFFDDEMAGHVMMELVKRGVHIPEDVTVTGFNGIRAAAAFVRPLTTLAIPVPALVARAVELIQQKNSQYRHCFNLELIKRASHGEARKQ